MTSKTEMDRLCGMWIEKSTVPVTSQYHGETYYSGVIDSGAVSGGRKCVCSACLNAIATFIQHVGSWITEQCVCQAIV